MAQKELRGRIASVKNVQKITRAMEMISAARLRRAEQRIQALRPYASAIRRMTRHAAEAAENIPNLPILNEHESVQRVGYLLVTSDRGLAGAFNSQIIRAGLRTAVEAEHDGREAVFYAAGRRGVGTLSFRKRAPVGATPASPTAPPTPTRATSPPTSWRPTSTATSTAWRSSTTTTSRRCSSA
jgi:F-type H+-transporting ATPase subunit gamma